MDSGATTVFSEPSLTSLSVTIRFTRYLEIEPKLPAYSPPVRNLPSVLVDVLQSWEQCCWGKVVYPLARNSLLLYFKIST
jgi:hypothetical protein